MANSLEGLERWNERYARDGYLFGEAPNAFLARQKDRLPATGEALAIADGDGATAFWLAQQGLTVLSVDYSPVAQEKAQRLAASRKVTIETQQASLYEWSWPPDRYDVVAAIFFQFASPSQRTLIFDGIRKTLKPGGLLLLEGYRPEQVDYGTGGPPHRKTCTQRPCCATISATGRSSCWRAMTRKSMKAKAIPESPR